MGQGTMRAGLAIATMLAGAGCSAEVGTGGVDEIAFAGADGSVPEGDDGLAVDSENLEGCTTSESVWQYNATSVAARGLVSCSSRRNVIFVRVELTRGTSRVSNSRRCESARLCLTPPAFLGDPAGSQRFCAFTFFGPSRTGPFIGVGPATCRSL